jgi:hypothetical protein
VAVLKYYDGSDWEPVVSALQGPTGPTGATGPTGPTGVDGNSYTAFRNLIINGDMQIAQRATSVTSITTNGYYTADRFRVENATMGTWTQSVENDAPTGSGFRKSLKMLCTTADASPAAADVILIDQIIEGQNLQHIAKGTSSAKQLTLSFWVKANVTGNYIAFLQDLDNNRSVSALYTVSASATWEKKTITFPADTTGAFDNDNAASLMLRFVLGVGTNWTSGTRNETWASLTLANLAAGQTVNLAAATNNYWQVTGVQLEVGSTATDFEFLPAQVELDLCQRYFYQSGEGRPIMNCTNGGLGNSYPSAIFYPVELRATPTITIYSGDALSGTVGSATWYAGGAGTVAAANQELNTKKYHNISRLGTNTYTLMQYSFSANAEL